MIPSVWDGVTPLRQVGLGVFKLTHDKTGELALAAAKRAVCENRSYTFARQQLPDGTDCFEVKTFEGAVIERHQVK